jgi:hypothetical protein
MVLTHVCFPAFLQCCIDRAVNRRQARTHKMAMHCTALYCTALYTSAVLNCQAFMPHLPVGNPLSLFRISCEQYLKAQLAASCDDD